MLGFIKYLCFSKIWPFKILTFFLVVDPIYFHSGAETSVEATFLATFPRFGVDDAARDRSNVVQNKSTAERRPLPVKN